MKVTLFKIFYRCKKFLQILVQAWKGVIPDNLRRIEIEEMVYVSTLFCNRLFIDFLLENIKHLLFIMNFILHLVWPI